MPTSSEVRSDDPSAPLAVHQLHKHYGHIHAVNGVSFTLQAAKLTAVLGPNGAGKTTLLEMCEGLRSPDSGHVSIFGRKPSEPSVKRIMGVQIDAASFHKSIKIKEILQLYARLYGCSEPASSIVDGLQLGDHWNSYYGGLSKGWKQRVSAAVALAHRPQIVFLDEISTGLDPEVKHVVWDVVMAERERGATVIMTTHSMEEAEHLADRLIIIYQGRILHDTSPSSLLGMAPSRAKVEVRSLVHEDVPDVVDRVHYNGRTILYTNDPARVKSWIAGAGKGEASHSEPLTLEDLYLYSIAKVKDVRNVAAN